MSERVAARCATARRIAFDQSTLQAHPALGWVEAHRQAGPHSANRELGLHTDHGVVGATHTRVREGCRTAAEYAGIVRLDVGVRTDYGSRTSVEMLRERDLLARSFSVKVDENDGRARLRFVDELVSDEERARGRRHEQCALQIDHRDVETSRRCADGCSAAGNPRGRQVRRPQDLLELVVEALAPLLAEGMISRCDHIGARVEQTFRDPRGDADPVGGVLTIDNTEVDLVIGPDRFQMLLDRPASGRAEDIGEEEDSQGSATLAAGTTSIWT